MYLRILDRRPVIASSLVYPEVPGCKMASLSRILLYINLKDWVCYKHLSLVSYI